MNITVLAYAETEGGADYDVAVKHVARALRASGHKVSILAVHADVKKLISGLSRRKPDLVFNLAETFGEDELGAIGLVGLLNLLGVRYTGVGPGEAYLQEDKVLTKKLLSFDQISYPDFAVFSKDADFEIGGNLRMPLFVKPLRMDASIGIDAQSLVHNASDLMQRVLMIHEQISDAALAEEYIDGRELYVGVLGNQEPVALPPIEMDFAGLPEGAPRIVDDKAKWDNESVEFQHTNAVVAELPEDLKARLQQVALSAYRALRVRDYGRVDLRLTESGDIYVIEVNASPHLEHGSELPQAAQAAGLSYAELVNKIVEHAVTRYEAHNSLAVKRGRGSPHKSPAGSHA
jgi:D-alanine-D-alanine ligase